MRGPRPAGAGHSLSAVKPLAVRPTALRGVFCRDPVQSICERTYRALFAVFVPAGQMTEPGHRITVEADQNPANPSGEL
jgi:hypothetical protein